MTSFPPPMSYDTQLPRRRAAPDAVAWVLLLLGGVLLAASGLFWLLRGTFFQSAIYDAVGGISWIGVDTLLPGVGRLVSLAVRLYGLAVFCMSLFVMTIAVTSYRNAERWAWYAAWIVPLYSAFSLAVTGAYHGLTATSVLWHLGLVCLALVALTVPYRRFFPNGTAQREKVAEV